MTSSPCSNEILETVLGMFIIHSPIIFFGKQTTMVQDIVLFMIIVIFITDLRRGCILVTPPWNKCPIILLQKCFMIVDNMHLNYY